MELNLHKVSQEIYIIIALLLIHFSGGFVFIYVYSGHIFMQMDIFKLFILSIGITAPIILANILLVHIKAMVQNTQFESLPKMLRLALIPSFLPLYVSALIGFFTEINKESGVGVVLIVEVLVCMFLLRSKLELLLYPSTKRL